MTFGQRTWQVFFQIADVALTRRDKMDIVVTIPKGEAFNQKKEDAFVARFQNRAVQFWKVSTRPKNLDVGDRVYFVEAGYITCWHTFIGLTYDPVCEVTNRVWPGLNLLLQCPPTVLKTPVHMPGFQGFQYIERLE
jgi:hypothetical protein